MKGALSWLGVVVLLAAATTGAWWALSRPAAPLPRSALALSISAGRQVEPVPFESQAVGVGLVEAVEARRDVRAPEGQERHLHPRDPDEWQGMLVDTDAKPPCESITGCGLGRACKDGVCVACERDTDCGPTETCVLDHCVLKDLATCRSRSDCARGSMCLLSGYTAKPRGNEEMRSFCVDPASGAARMEQSDERPPVDTRTSLPGDDLLKRAREALNAK